MSPFATRPFVALLLLGTIGTSGCSALRMGMHLAGPHWGEHYEVSRTGEGPVEERLYVLLDDAPPPPPAPPAPPPDVVVDAPLPPPVVVLPPPFVVIAPEPLPEPPPPPPSIAFSCTLEERFVKERVRQGVVEFGFIEKLTLMFPLAFNSIVSVALLSGAFDDKDFSRDDAAELAIGSVLLADAIGIAAILIFMPQTRTEWESLHDGAFRPRAQGCPRDLVIERDGRRMTLDERGLLSLADESFLVRALSYGGGVDVVHGRARVTLTPPRGQVCRWASDRGLQAPLCVGPSESSSVPAGGVLLLSSASSSTRRR